MNGQIEKTVLDGENVELKKQWWIVLRRSFAIPDLVTNEHALAVIVEAVAPDVLPTNLKKPLVRLLIAALLGLGSRGELDRFVIPTRYRDCLEPKPVLDLCHEVVQRIRQHPRFGEFAVNADEGLDEGLEDATMAIIDRLNPQHC